MHYHKGRLSKSGLWSFRDIPSHLHEYELASRQTENVRPVCGSGNARENYNTFLHFAALVLILLLSTLACSFPIIARRFPRLPIPHRMLFLSRHFGTGVLIATAFVHLLPTAFASLTDPCLPSFWNEGYPAMAGFIAMVSVLVVVSIEMFFAMRGAGHIHSSQYEVLHEESNLLFGNSCPAADSQAPIEHSQSIGANQSMRLVPRQSINEDECLEAQVSVNETRPRRPQNPAKRTPQPSVESFSLHLQNEEEESDMDLDNMDGTHGETGRMSRRTGNNHRSSIDLVNSRSVQENISSNKDAKSGNSEEKKMLLQCLLLEAGILFHSIFIGMALSVATGASFMVLLVAISFHQTFEGFALGSRIAAITAFGPGSPKPWLMALAYGTTTPIGQAIGLVVHNMYDPMSETGLLLVGIMNAISSGLLLFAGLVELLAEDFLSDKSYEILQGTKRIHACAAVAGGSLLMALVGAFA